MNLSALHPNGRPAGNRWLTYFAACALLLYAGSGLAQLEPAPEGRVRFYNIADTDFDRYSKRPNEGDQAWMRANFSRMQTYSPYFDRRTAWFSNAWVYKDSYAIKPHWPEYREHPDWILRDADGNKLFIPWGCKKGTCPQYAGDVGNPAFRAHWIAAAREKLAQGYRGIWVDDVNLTWRVSDGNGEHVRPIDPRTGEPMVLADWRRYFAEFMEELRAALPDVELAHNAIWYAGPFDDPFIRRQIDAADFINLERGASDGGLKRGDGKFGFERFLAFVDLVHGRGKAVIMMDYGDSAQQREYGLAAWLLISSGRDLMSSDQLSWTAPRKLWAGYRLDLGPARGPRQAWRDLLRRDFECGLVLLNQPGWQRHTVNLPASYRRIDGQRVSRITLRGAEAAVLLDECATVGPAD